MPAPRRVAFLAPFGLRPKGTTAARALPIARVLAAQGATVRLIIPPWDDPGAAGQVVREGNLEIVQAALAWRPLRPLALLCQLRELVRQFQPEVLHVFKPIGYSGLIGWWAATGRLGDLLPVLDTDDYEGLGGWSSRRRLGLEGWVRGWQEVRTVRAFGQATVASEWLGDYVRRLGIRSDRVLRLPNGHAGAPPLPLGVGAGQDRPVRGEGEPAKAVKAGPAALLWYTRFTEAEPERVAGLVAPLLQAQPTLRLIILGDEMRRGDSSRAAAALTRVGVAGQVEWSPYWPTALEETLATRELVAVYPLDDDLVNRARCPAKIVELMALGVPVVAEAVGEAAGYLAGFQDECLALPGDQPRFQHQLGRLVTDSAARRSLATRLEAASAQWRWDRLADGLLDWYEKLIRAG